MLHYRALFGDLLGQPAETGSPGEAPAESVSPEPVMPTATAAEPGTDSGIPADAEPVVPAPRNGPGR
jgi:hypothetical protein